MKIAIASFEYEGNSLSEKTDGLEFFKNSTLAFDEDSLDIVKNQKIAISAAIDVLNKNNCEVKAILTKSGKEFVTPLSITTLTIPLMIYLYVVICFPKKF